MRHSSQPAVTLSVRVSSNTRLQRENTGRTKPFLAAEAIEFYLSTQIWQVQAIEAALKKANNSNTHFVAHQRVADWLNSWGNT